MFNLKFGILFLSLFTVTASAMSQESLNLINDVRETEARVQSRLRTVPRDSTRTIVIGVTGSGKSVFVHAIGGIPIMMLVREGKTKLEPAKILDGFSIGHGAESETTLPGLWYDKNNHISYCDCPGFLDSRTDAQRVANSFAIDQLFITPNRIKILLLISEPEFEAARAGTLKEMFESTMKLIPESTQLERSIALVITKSTRTPAQYMNGISDSDFGKNNDLFKFFLKRCEGFDKRVFSFPAPKSEYGIYDSFADRDLLIQWLKKDPIENPKHSIVLGEKSQMYVLQVSASFNRDLEGLISNFVDMVSGTYRQENDFTLLKGWKDSLESLAGASMNNSDEFVNFVRSNIKNSGVFADILDQISRFQPWQTFVIGLSKNSEFLSMNQQVQDIVKPNISAMLGRYLNPCMKELACLIQRGEEEEKVRNAIIKERDAEIENIRIASEQEQKNLKESLETGRIKEEEMLAKMKELETKSNQDREEAEKRLQEALVKQKAESEHGRDELFAQLQASAQKDREESRLLMQQLMDQQRRHMEDLDRLQREREKEREIAKNRMTKEDWDDAIQGVTFLFNVADKCVDWYKSK